MRKPVLTRVARHLNAVLWQMFNLSETSTMVAWPMSATTAKEATVVADRMFCSRAKNKLMMVLVWMCVMVLVLK